MYSFRVYASLANNPVEATIRDERRIEPKAEAGQLLEVFQWKTTDEVRTELSTEDVRAASEELADILIREDNSRSVKFQLLCRMDATASATKSTATTSAIIATARATPLILFKRIAFPRLSTVALAVAC